MTGVRIWVQRERVWCHLKPMQASHTCVTNNCCWGKWSLICELIEVLEVPVLRRLVSINIGPSRNKDEIQAGNLGTPR